MKTTAYKFIKLLGKVVFGLPFLLVFVNCSGQKKFILKEEKTLNIHSEQVLSINEYFYHFKTREFFIKSTGSTPYVFSFKWVNNDFQWEKTDTFTQYGCGATTLLKDYSAQSFLHISTDREKRVFELTRPAKDKNKRQKNFLPTVFSNRQLLNFFTTSAYGCVLPGDILVAFAYMETAISANLSYTPILLIKLLPNKEVRIIDTIGVPIPEIYEVEKYREKKYFFPLYKVVLGGYNPNENSFIAGYCLGNTFYKISDIRYNKDTTKILSYSMQSFEIYSDYFHPDSIPVFSENITEKGGLKYMHAAGSFAHVKYDPEQEIYLQLTILPTDYSGLYYSYLNFSIIAYDKNLQKIGEYVVFNNNGKMFPFFEVLPGSRLAFISGDVYSKRRTKLLIYRYKLE